MATFLELVKDLARESGTLSPNSIANVTAQTGRAEKMVSWVRKAWENIQNSRSDWMWMRGEFEGALITGANAYTSASFNLGRWGRWIEDSDEFLPVSLYDPALGVSDEDTIRQIDYNRFFALYGRGSQTSDRPAVWAMRPNGEIVFGPTPDKHYAIRLIYQKSPQVLAANDDVPEMPTRFHELITLEAHRLLMLHDGAYNEGTSPQMEYARLIQALEVNQLPQVRIGGNPIA